MVVSRRGFLGAVGACLALLPRSIINQNSNPKTRSQLELQKNDKSYCDWLLHCSEINFDRRFPLANIEKRDEYNYDLSKLYYTIDDLIRLTASQSEYGFVHSLKAIEQFVINHNVIKDEDKKRKTIFDIPISSNFSNFQFYDAEMIKLINLKVNQYCISIQSWITKKCIQSFARILSPDEFQKKLFEQISK